MAHAGDVGTEIAPEVADDPEQRAAFKVELDGDGHAARKFFNLSERYERWRDYRVDPRGRGLHGLDLAPGEEGGRRYGLLQLSDKADGADFTAEDADRLSELAAFTGRPWTPSGRPRLATSDSGWPPGGCEERPAYVTLAAGDLLNTQWKGTR